MKTLHNKVDRTVLKAQIEQDDRQRTTLSFYVYYNLHNTQLFRDHLYILLSECEVMGRIYVAREGVNGQLSVPNDQIDNFKEAMDKIVFFRGIRHNYAIEDDGKSFYKLAIKVRNKIVADGLVDSEFDVTDKGVHLSAQAFNDLVKQENTIVVDLSLIHI